MDDLTNLEATVFAYALIGLCFGMWLYAVDIVRTIRKTTRDYRSRSITTRRNIR
jgi:hypothetical protein